MSCIREFLRRAEADLPVYISDVREAFAREGERPCVLLLRLYDGSERRFDLRLPRFETAQERAFGGSFLHATLYNCLSALGARGVEVCFDPADEELKKIIAALPEVFQVGLARRERSGHGKCLNVNERTLAALCGQGAAFCIAPRDIATLPPAREEAAAALAGAPVFDKLPARAAGRILMGMDVGGTDVKLAASVDGALRVFKEYDWFPAGFDRAEALIEPMLLLTRLMRDGACCHRALGGVPAAFQPAFDKEASDAQMRDACEGMEALLGGRLEGFDAIGLCFPDVVVRGRIVGGETPKTQGMRENRALDYETEFAKLAGLCERLRAYVREGGAVLNTNDGPMAAFTSAVEQAAAGAELSRGFFAHTLGTDLGTGWVLPDGSIPEMPLEVYNFIVDLGSFGQRAFDPEDVRSVRNVNTGLCGTLQKCAGQSGVFRLGAKYLPERDPKTYARLFERGLFAREGERLFVPTAPADMRKPCLEFFMREAEDPSSVCAELFRAVGESLGVCWKETQYILRPACEERTLFGRLVKTEACFARICEGARRVAPGLVLRAADGALANTPLMRQLAAHPHYTVAQFGQAVGAIYFGCLGLEDCAGKEV